MSRFSILTLGCRTNQYESQALREAWTARGLAETQDLSQADVVLVNSCAVTHGAVRDTRRAARRAAREAPGAEIIVARCAAQAAPDELVGLPKNARLVPQAEKGSLLAGPKPDGETGVPDTCEFTITRYARARPVLKVQDGCSHRCTYCIVPLARGGPRSKPVSAVIEEAGKLLDAGHRELVLSGINLRQYGLDLRDRPDFWDLVVRLEEFLWNRPEQARIRLSSLDPGQLTPKALKTLTESRLVCPHLHLSVQSAGPRVLGLMGRGYYRPRDIQEFVFKLSLAWPKFALGADILTGFPGETREDFKLTREFMAALPLTYAHVFPFSPRPGTRAAEFENRVPDDEVKARAKELRRLAGIKKRTFRSALVNGSPLTMVVERGDPAGGICEYYVDCSLNGDAGAADGELLAVRPVKSENGRLVVERVDQG